jgi:secondary thiamine-phosphate synthase enzyme
MLANLSQANQDEKAGAERTMAEMVQASHKLDVETGGKGFTEITRELSRWLDTLSAESGLLTVFICHTSASLVIQENADPNVRRDLLGTLEALAPEGSSYAHQEEGPDDMPSHIKSMLTEVSISIPVIDGSMVLGTWQGVYVVEHRAAPHRRTMVLSYIGNVAQA